MSKVYDITNSLETEKPRIKIFNKEYEVDHNSKKMIKIRAMQKEVKEDTDDEVVLKFMANALVLLLGEKNAKEVEDLGLCMKDYRNVIVACMSLASGNEVKLEEAEAKNTP